VGALSAAGSAWSARGRHATVVSGRGWLGVVVARQADLSGRLGATGRRALTGGILVHFNYPRQGSHVSQKVLSRTSCATWITVVVDCKLQKYILEVCLPSFPQIDSISAVPVVGWVREKIISSDLFSIVCNNCAQYNAHTYEQT